MVGGRPNQALYFIGYVGEDALFLDPHTTQRCGTVGDKSEAAEIEMDETFHQKYAARINFKQMDPSLALVFDYEQSDDYYDFTVYIVLRRFCVERGANLMSSV